MKISRKELQELHQGLRKCGNLTGEKFTYMVEKNVGKMMAEFKRVQKYAESIRPKPTEKLTEFGKTDEIIYTDLKEGRITEAIAKERQEDLKLQYPDEAKLSEEFVEKVTAFEKEEIEIEFHTVKRSDLPPALTADQRIGIGLFIEE